MTKAQEAYALIRKLRGLRLEMAQDEQRLSALKSEMGHPTEYQIERAAEAGKTIARGCTQ